MRLTFTVKKVEILKYLIGNKFKKEYSEIQFLKLTPP